MPKGKRASIDAQLDMLKELNKHTTREGQLLDLLISNVKNADYIRANVKTAVDVPASEKEYSLDSLKLAILWQLDLMYKLAKYVEKYKKWTIDEFQHLVGLDRVLLSTYDPFDGAKLYDMHIAHDRHSNGLLLAYKDVVAPHEAVVEKIKRNFRESTVIFKKYESTGS